MSRKSAAVASATADASEPRRSTRIKLNQPELDNPATDSADTKPRIAAPAKPKNTKGKKRLAPDASGAESEGLRAKKAKTSVHRQLDHHPLEDDSWIKDLPRSAKSGNDWTEMDLKSFNIRVRREDVATFFGRELQDSTDRLDPNLFSPIFSARVRGIQNVSEETSQFLTYLKMASRLGIGMESAAGELMINILELLGYIDPEIFVRTRCDIPFANCGDPDQVATPNVYLSHPNARVLLITQQSRESHPDPEPLVIAQAIAAFRCNNKQRSETGREMLDQMVIPCITLVNAKPFFYKVPVTTQLSEAVKTGEYPTQPTVVTTCSPPSQTLFGMQLPEYRRVAFQYFYEFRLVSEACRAPLID